MIIARGKTDTGRKVILIGLTREALELLKSGGEVYFGKEYAELLPPETDISLILEETAESLVQRLRTERSLAGETPVQEWTPTGPAQEG